MHMCLPPLRDTFICSALPSERPLGRVQLWNRCPFEPPHALGRSSVLQNEACFHICRRAPRVQAAPTVRGRQDGSTQGAEAAPSTGGADDAAAAPTDAADVEQDAGGVDDGAAPMDTDAGPSGNGEDAQARTAPVAGFCWPGVMHTEADCFVGTGARVRADEQKSIAPTSSACGA